MQIKLHQEYNPSNYACYAITSIEEDFTLNTVHPSGLQEYLDYDVYDIGNKYLIAFTKINFDRTDFVYRVVSANYTEDINAENYENLLEIIDGTYDQAKNVFHIMQSASNFSEAVGNNPVSVDESRRCDVGNFAAVDFYDIIADGKSDFLDREYFNNTNILGWPLILASMGNVYIVRLKVEEMNDRAYKDWASCVLTAATFSNALKMAYEWSTLAQDPWNSQQSVALKCKAAFQEWQMPQDVIDAVVQSQPATSIELFLTGDSDPRRSIEENKILPVELKNWFTSKLRYRTIVSLMKNYPTKLDIPTSMIEEEKKFFEKEIYKFCIENKLNIDTVTSVEIVSKAYFSGPLYKEVNNSITDIIIKNLYLEDLPSVLNYINDVIKK